jgi:hypothetical protein
MIIKKIKPIALVAILLFQPILVHAGFLSTYFENVGSDSLQKNSLDSTNPKLKKQKIQGALAVMQFYNGKLDGDFNTFESRTAIKRLQEKLNLEQSGFLSDKEKNQLTYLSNLYASLKSKDIERPKKIAIYDEIDSTKESMINKTLIQEYLSCLNEELHSVRVIADLEDAKVFINGQETSTILLGYSPLLLESGEYEIEVNKISENNEWVYSGKKTVVIKNLSNIDIEITKNETVKRKNRIKDEAEKRKNRSKKDASQRKNRSKEGARIKEAKRLSLWNSKEIINDNKNFAVWEDSKRIKKGMSLVNSRRYCDTLEFSHRSNWRLPSSEEAFMFINLHDRTNNTTPKAYEESMLLYDSGLVKYTSPRRIHDSILDTKIFPLRCISDNSDKQQSIKNAKKEIAEYVGVNEYPNNIYIDKKNKLMWEAGNAGHRDNESFDTANNHCEKLGLGNYKDWRLPSGFELRYFYKELPQFIHFEDGYFWTNQEEKNGSKLRYASRSNKLSTDSSWYSAYKCVREI